MRPHTREPELATGLRLITRSEGHGKQAVGSGAAALATLALADGLRTCIAALEAFAAAHHALVRESYAAPPSIDSERRPRDLPTRSGAVKLTQRQAQVARLVAQGFTNKEIAEHLVLSVRTVEAHITHALNTAGCRSRAQLAILATQRDLDDSANGI